MAKVLVIDDEALVINVLSKVLKTGDHDVEINQDGREALTMLDDPSFDLTICDLKMSPVDGMQILKAAREKRPDMPILMVTGYATVATAVEALKLGAFDYITKPFKIDELLSTVKRALDYGAAVSGRDESVGLTSSHYGLEGIVAVTATMRSLCETAKRVAPTDAPVLIVGEAGTGRATLARALHNNSSRKSNPFTRVACASIPESEFEEKMFGLENGYVVAGKGGTLLLEELEAMPPNIQSRLETMIREDKEDIGTGTGANVRFMATTTSHPETLMEDGHINRGLYYRLKGIQLNIPPLRSRAEDIVPMCLHLLSLEAAEGEEAPLMAHDARDTLSRYSWPGNVTELEAAMQYAVKACQGEKITREFLPTDIVGAVALDKVDAGTEFGRGEKLKEFLQQKLGR